MGEPLLLNRAALSQIPKRAELAVLLDPHLGPLVDDFSPTAVAKRLKGSLIV